MTHLIAIFEWHHFFSQPTFFDRFFRKSMMRTRLVIALGLVAFSAHPILGQQGNASQSAVKQDSLQLVAMKAKPNQPGIYHLILVSSDSLPRNAVFELTFPPDFGLEPLEVAGSRDITGGLRLQKKNRTVVLQRTGLGNPVPPGKTAILKLGLIRNPAILDSVYAVKVVLRNPDTSRIIIDKLVRVHFQLQ
ncbi:MAG: hypothetical protein Q9P14_07045 [candidate division KSB1 bacterium]|nr:hypothetical protein [candidate division KSB1 bacterium]MDQ7063442.1 hypothetical protein [candidate division KSB1 bacterium]